MNRYDTIKTVSSSSVLLEYHINDRKKNEWTWKKFRVVKREKKEEIGSVTFAQHNGYIRRFKNEVKRNIDKNPELKDLSITEKLSRTMGTRGRDLTEIENLLEKEQMFYEFDIDLAYFQTCFILGYISEDFYNKYINIRELKQSMREAVTWLSKRIKKEYYLKGQSEPYKTESEKPELKHVHDNVRAFLSNTIDGAINVAKNDYLAHTIDSITFKANSFLPMKEYFKSQNVNFKIKPCIKIDENNFKSGNKIVTLKTQQNESKK